MWHYWHDRLDDLLCLNANFLGTVGLGIASIFFSRYKKMPMIIFYIPSLVPLVPGGPAYQAVRSILLGNIDDGLQLILKVVFTAAAIAAGFMVTSLLERIVKRFFPKRLFRLVKK